MLPKARLSDELVITQVGDELVIYDRVRDRAHSLNPTAAFVFQHCNGQTSTDQLTALLAAEHHLSQERAAQVMWLALQLLEEAHLLKWRAKRGARPLTRRRILMMAGAAAATTVAAFKLELPVVTSILAPTPAEACASGGWGGGGGGGGWWPWWPWWPWWHH